MTLEDSIKKVLSRNRYLNKREIEEITKEILEAIKQIDNEMEIIERGKL